MEKQINVGHISCAMYKEWNVQHNKKYRDILNFRKCYGTWKWKKVRKLIAK